MTLFGRSAPVPRDGRPAPCTGTVVEGHFEHPIAEPLDHCRPALRAKRMLVRPDATRQVAGIDVSQAAAASDLCGAEQRACAGVVRLEHLVIFVKGGDMPWNVR